MESPQARKSGLNLPAGMSSITSLRLETLSTPPSSASPRAISNLSSSSSPSKTSSCSDRFIPCRSSSRLHTFGLIDKPSPVKEGSNEAYSRLLKCELFGSDFASPSSPAGCGGAAGGPASPMMSPSKNMLRFKTDHSGPSSPFSSNSPSIFGHHSGFSNESATPPKPPRKVPKTPHKVLDAPSLQDDFYLNLVDWSSQNTLAVGLGTCVYLWSASNSKVTKLCDLGPYDGVCSVQWTKEGSLISIGINLGPVQTIVTSAGDETLRFWNIFPSMKTPVNMPSTFNYDDLKKDKDHSTCSRFRNFNFQSSSLRPVSRIMVYRSTRIMIKSRDCSQKPASASQS